MPRCTMHMIVDCLLELAEMMRQVSKAAWMLPSALSKRNHPPLQPHQRCQVVIMCGILQVPLRHSRWMTTEEHPRSSTESVILDHQGMLVRETRPSTEAPLLPVLSTPLPTARYITTLLIKNFTPDTCIPTRVGSQVRRVATNEPLIR